MTAQDELNQVVKDHELPVILEFLGDHAEIVRVTLNRPKQLNCIPPRLHAGFDELWTKFEELSALRVAILTGAGRVFCAGADLKEWLQNPGDTVNKAIMEAGFLGISNRSSKKPIIAALNGPSYGGGTETLLNCDLVVALRSATISLPEVRKGVVALAGALPRLGRSLSLQQANELALVAEPVTAARAEQWGIVNRVVDTLEELQEVSLGLAKSIALGAPEAIYVSHRGIRKGYEDTKLSLYEATRSNVENEAMVLFESDNYLEGLQSFMEKRQPKWSTKDLKL